MTEVSLSQLEAALAEGAPLIDVREPDEFEQVRVPEAVLIPCSEFVERCGEIPEAETVYIICAVGGRSLQVANYLQARDINAVSVAGGTTAWMQSGRSVESGAPATV
ncbi:MAG: rhodanese-like domain-containing protein [Rhodococcus sp.]|nr:rhodanese-like domain-containing protein [Rhodococcus sp. (in: high G+C Gram-positive bacteria)]